MIQYCGMRNDHHVAIDLLANDNAVGHARVRALTHLHIDGAAHRVYAWPLKPCLSEPKPIGRFHRIGVEDGLFPRLREV